MNPASPRKGREFTPVVPPSFSRLTTLKNPITVETGLIYLSISHSQAKFNLS